MTNRFDRDTAVHAVASEGETGVHEGRIDRGWWIVRGPNGGYVAALLLRALSAAVPADRAPRSLTVHYTAPPAEGAVRVHTRVERTGRSLSTVSGRMLQGDRLLALALGAFSSARPGPRFDHARMPAAPAPEDCPSFASAIPMHDRYEYRWAIGAPPGGEAPAPPGPGADRRAPGGRGEALSGGWIRLAEPRVVDAPLVAAYTDAWPPACFSWSGPEAIGPVPTVDLTIHFRSELPRAGARPEDWCLARFRSRLAAGGFVEEDGEVWSRDGSLLAQSRQLAVIG
ncbi:MAG TPA: thioesterase family protein [Myxococcota bacterium]|nr:thioesterase family protein [Myxococcota bacterium]